MTGAINSKAPDRQAKPDSSNYMDRALLILFALTLFLSCREEKQPDKFVFKPTSEPFGKYADHTFDEAFFSTNCYSYAELAKVDSLEKLTGKTILDTTRYFYSAEAFVVEQNDTSYFRTCKAKLVDTSLSLFLIDEPFAQRSTGLEITKSGNHFIAKYIITAIPTDSSYKLPIFTSLNQTIFFEK